MDQSIAGDPIYAWAHEYDWDSAEPKKQVGDLEWIVDNGETGKGGRSTHLTEDDQVRRRSWEDFRLPSTSWSCTPSSRSTPF